MMSAEDARAMYADRSSVPAAASASMPITAGKGSRLKRWIVMAIVGGVVVWAVRRWLTAPSAPAPAASSVSPPALAARASGLSKKDEKNEKSELVVVGVVGSRIIIDTSGGPADVPMLVDHGDVYADGRVFALGVHLVRRDMEDYVAISGRSDNSSGGGRVGTPDRGSPGADGSLGGDSSLSSASQRPSAIAYPAPAPLSNRAGRDNR